MFHTAFAAGIPWRDIGGMSVGDIALAAKARQEKDKEFSKILAWIVYNGAALTGIAVNDPKRFPSLETAFPSLFEQQEQQDWRRIKERMTNYVNAKNKR